MGFFRTNKTVIFVVVAFSLVSFSFFFSSFFDGFYFSGVWSRDTLAHSDRNKKPSILIIRNEIYNGQMQKTMTRRISNRHSLRLWAEFFCRCVEHGGIHVVDFIVFVAVVVLSRQFGWEEQRRCVCVCVFADERVLLLIVCTCTMFAVCEQRAAKVGALHVCACHTLRDNTHSRTYHMVDRRDVCALNLVAHQRELKRKNECYRVH